MTVTFEEGLQDVLKKKLISREDRQSYTKDAEYLRNFLMERLKEKREDFKNVFTGLSLTGSYLDGLKIDLPDEFDLHMKLKFPFEIKPMQDHEREGYIKLVTKSKPDFFLTCKRNKISRYELQMWLRGIFISAIGEGLEIKTSSRIYKVVYPKYGRGYGVAHTIIATDIHNANREISFDFVAAFEFSPAEFPSKKDKFKNKDQSWFAVPAGKVVKSRKEKANSYAFMACAPLWERSVFRDKNNLKNSLRLMKALRDAHKLNHLTSYMLKSVYLLEIDNQQPEFWQLPMGVILIAMLEVLVESLEDNRLPFYLHKGINILDRIPHKVATFYKVKVEQILRKLKSLSNQNVVDLQEVFNLFKV